MEMQSRKFTVDPLAEDTLTWFVETAATSMVLYELGRPELLNYDQLYALSQMALESGTAFIVKCNQIPVGAIGGLIMPNLFNPTFSTLAEVIWYVLPEYRNTRAGAMLLSSFTARGDEIAAETTLSLLPSSEVNVNTMQKRGFNLEEYGFRKRNN